MVLRPRSATDKSFTPRCGSSRQALRGATFLVTWASGTPSTFATAGGARRAFGTKSSLTSPPTATTSGTASTAASFEPIRTPREDEAARKKNAIGKSRGGHSTKIHARVDALGLLVALTLTPGQAHDSVKAIELIDAASADAYIMDRAYDAMEIRDHVKGLGAVAVVPSKSNRREPIPHDQALYRERHAIENFFQRLKRFRKIATRYAKTRVMFRGAILLAAITDWLR